jgi:hypothetical protein
MAGTAHITHQLTRWPGKPTSGRFVYRSKARPGRWWWQCDLCEQPDYEDDAPGFSSWRDALSEALRHADVCTERTHSTEP